MKLNKTFLKISTNSENLRSSSEFGTKSIINFLGKSNYLP